MSQKISEMTEATTLGDDDMFIIVQDSSGENRKINKSNVASSIGVKSRAFTVGVPGVSGVDYNFTSVANSDIQSIQLGGEAFVPINSAIYKVISLCTDGLNGAITANIKEGFTSASSDIADSNSLDDSGEGIVATVLGGNPSAAQSVWFSVTPSDNWDTTTSGSWKIIVSFVDTSLL